MHGKVYVKMLTGGLVIPCEISLAHSDMPGKAVIFKKKKSWKVATNQSPEVQFLTYWVCNNIEELNSKKQELTKTKNLHLICI